VEKIVEAEEVGATWVVATSLPFAYEKNGRLGRNRLGDVLGY
jgi:hypothetical protein